MSQLNSCLQRISHLYVPSERTIALCCGHVAALTTDTRESRSLFAVLNTAKSLIFGELVNNNGQRL